MHTIHQCTLGAVNRWVEGKHLKESQGYLRVIGEILDSNKAKQNKTEHFQGLQPMSLGSTFYL